jgi:hypothetical protein
MSKITLVELKKLLSKIQDRDLDIVLVGGQAVNYWAYYYQEREPLINQYIPFSSEDIDFFGGRLEANITHQLLGGEIKLNRNFDPSPNTGVLLVPFENRKLRIDFLSSVYGLNDSEILESAIISKKEGFFSDLNLKILNPILCLEGKLKSLVGLPQQGRQDLKHLQISVLCAKEYLKERRFSR